MGLFFVLLGGISSFLLYSAGRWLAFWLAMTLTFILFWSHGVMHNFATESAERRPGFRGGFYEFTVRDLDAIPDRLAWVNGLSSIASIGFFVYGMYTKFFS